MAMKNALKIYTICKTVALISFITTLGGCCACMGSMKTEYGAEEYYQKPGGGVGYGARSSTSGTHPFDFLAVISGVVCVISGIGAGLYYGETEEGQRAMTAQAQKQIDKERRSE